MAPRIEGFLSRSDCGLRRPTSVSRRAHPDRGGLACHYGGGPQRIRSHGQCVERWRAWQRHHMGTQGWSDIAYNAGYCDHGYVLAGRGYGVRSAAQGTADGNDRYMAIVWIGGDGETPTRKALDAFEWLIREFRTQGAGLDVRPHSSFKSTGCPGDPLRAFCQSHHGRRIGPTPEEETMARIEIDAEVVGIYHNPAGEGFWVVDEHGGVFALQGASYRGSMPELYQEGHKKPSVGLARNPFTPTPTGKGYLIAFRDGATYSFGDAKPIGADDRVYAT